MDTNGCPEGYATDIAFQLRTATEPCTVPMAAFWSVTLFLFVMRFAAAVKQAMTWHRLNIKLDRKRRKPFAVSLSFALVVCQIVSSLCIGINLANVHNGLSWMLMSLTMLPYFIQTAFAMLRMVRLGERIIPLGRQMGVQPEVEGGRSLRRFSKGGRFLAFWQFASATVSSTTLIILSPVDPSHQDLHGTIGLAFKAQFVSTATAGMIYQLYRCVLVVKRMQRNIQEMNMSSSKEAFAKTQASIRTMHRRMMIAFIAGVPSSTCLALIAFHVIPRNVWWVLIIPGATETFLAVGIEFVAMSQRSPAGVRSQGGDPDLVRAPSSAGNKVEPRMHSSSVLVVAPRPAPEIRGDEGNT